MVVALAKTSNNKTQKPKYNMWQSSAYMIAIALKSYKSVLVLCIVLAALSVGLSLLGLFIAPTILQLVEYAVPLDQLILTILLFTGATLVVGAVESYFVVNKKWGRIAIRFKVLSDIHDKISTTSYPNTENQDVRKKLEKAQISVSGPSQATETIWNTFTDVLKNIAGFVIYIALLTTLELWIIVLAVATTVIGFFISNYVNRWGYLHRDEEADYSRRMNYIGENARDYTLAKDIRIFDMKEWLNDIYDSTLRLYQAFIKRGEKVYIWGNIADVILSFARNGIAYAYLIRLVLSDALSASQFLLYFSIIGGFTAWVSGILSQFSTLHKQCLDISAVREFLEYPEQFAFEDGQPIEPDASKPYKIELKNVSFRYPEAEKDTLININLEINPGEKLAVLGLNGAGKTTLVKLICGFYDPTVGEVLMNGENIKQYNRRDYYKHFSAVFQDFSVLATNISENITQSDENIIQEKLDDCAEKVGLLNKIDNLPQKYETHVTKRVFEDGIDFSGGELQRLMLARALYKDAPIIILDEPTAALDPIAESELYNKYNDLTGGRTSVYISHRLASTRFCDRIILIDEGQIIEEGTHDSLIEKGGKYAQLFDIQSHYYRADTGGVSNG